jgi:8-oxo-dGTP pyrophosphatase MutT (NUDIX family)
MSISNKPGNHLPPDLARFLQSGTKLYVGAVTWRNNTQPVEVTYYSTRQTPPPEYVSSVRAILFKGDSVLVVREPHGHLYILPGGRVEKGESFLQTLERELLEETGWTISSPRVIGCMHLHHLGPRPKNYKYPYPDFFWPVYAAETKASFPDARQPDKWVAETFFSTIDEVRKLPLEQGQLMLLEEALKT